MAPTSMTTTTTTTTMMLSEPQGQAGVGIYFQQEGESVDVYVKSLVKGASAERDGTVKVGDVIVTVDGRNVIGQSLATLRSLIRGEVGTYVDLGFKRIDPYTGDAQAFEVSLMRGGAEYLAWMERRELETLLAEFRGKVQDCENEIERLRRRMRELQRESDDLRAEEIRIRPMIDAHKDSLQQQQQRSREEMERSRELEDQIAPLTEQRDRGKRELERYRKQLHQVEDQLLAAKDALDDTQRRFAEVEDATLKQAQARADCEARMRKTEEELARRREEDAHSREEQERLRHQMELDVRALRNRLSQEQHETVRERQRREAAYQHVQNLEEDRQRLESENARLQKLLRDADGALQQSQLGKTQVEAMSTELHRAATKLADQGRVQESQIEDGKKRLVEERDRWEKSVQQVQVVRQEEAARFVAREEQLTTEHNRVADLYQQTRMSMETERSKLNDILSRITPETAAISRTLQQERQATEELREEMNAAGKRMEEAGSRLLESRDQLQKVQTAVQAQNAARQRVEARAQGIEEEILSELQKELLRANFAAELEKRAEQERVELEEVLRREEEKRRIAESNRLQMEEGVKPLVEKIRILQQRDKEYMARLDEARVVHGDLVARFHELVRQQQNVRAGLLTARNPYDELYGLGGKTRLIANYAHPQFTAPDPLLLGGPRRIAGLLPAPPPVYSQNYRSSLDPVIPRGF